MNQDEQNKYHEDSIRELSRHADTSNREVGEIRTDINWIKEQLNKLDSKIWWILTSVIVLPLIGIIITLIKR